MRHFIKACLIGGSLGAAFFAFAGCSTTDGIGARKQKGMTGDYVQIEHRGYDSETRSFDRPWPFGPEGGAQ